MLRKLQPSSMDCFPLTGHVLGFQVMKSLPLVQDCPTQGLHAWGIGMCSSTENLPRTYQHGSQATSLTVNLPWTGQSLGSNALGSQDGEGEVLYSLTGHYRSYHALGS